MSIIGNNNLVFCLRVLSSLELFLNAEYYCQHPIFIKSSNSFSSVSNVFYYSLSKSSVDSGLKNEDAVKFEATSMLTTINKWSGFLSLLALSSVLGLKIFSYYPDSGLEKYRTLFNQEIFPRELVTSPFSLHILFCALGAQYFPFKPNHFVSLFFKSDNLSSSASENVLLPKKKPKLSSPRETNSILTYFSKTECKSAFTPNLTSSSCTFSSNLSTSSTPTFSTNPSTSSDSVFYQDLSTASAPTFSTNPSTSSAPAFSQNLSTASAPTFSTNPSTSSDSAFSQNLSTSSSPTFSTNPSTSSAPAFSQNLSISAFSTNLSISNATTVSINFPTYAIAPTSISSSSSGFSNKSVFCDKNDVAFLKEKVSGLSDGEIFKTIQSMSSPPNDYVYPIIQGRSFQKRWLNDYCWLRYSIHADGVYCLPCVLFGERYPKKSRIKKLVSEPYTSWRNASSDFRTHEEAKNGVHKFTFPIFINLCNQMTGKFKPIDTQINNQISANINKNRLILRSIVDTVIHCARTNSSFRGHRDDFKYLPLPGGWSSDNIGVFNQTLNYSIRSGNSVLKDHLLNCPKNATYISKSTQNELIKCCGEEISENILSRVKQAKYFSILADEACDISTKEQMAIVLRYVDEEYNIREEFIRFVHCSEGLSGKDLSVVLLNCIQELNLDIMNCRGQGYDGAGSVSGYINGLSAILLRINPKALYVHCHSHRLNLVVCDSCRIPIICDVFDKVREVSDFFNSSETRLKFIEANILADNSSSSKCTKLKDVCRTRWIERIDGLSIFLNNFLIIYNTLNDMSSNKGFNRDTKVKANNFLHCVGNFSFVFPLVVVTRTLELTLPVTRLLQGRSIDILQGMHLIDSLKSKISKLRLDMDTIHNSWYGEAVSLAEKLDIPIIKNRTCGRQMNRENVPSDNTSEYFKRSVSVPFLDHMIVSLDQRFKPETLNVYKGLSIIPSNLLKQSTVTDKTIWIKQFECFSEIYKDDFPNFSLLHSELDTWDEYWKTFKGNIPENISDTLKAASFGALPNIFVALRILATLPVTSCECERSFSALRRLKDYTRSTMTSERLNGLALMYVHREIVPDIEKVIDRFAITNRRLDF